MKIAGIVLYDSDIERLKQNIVAISPQVDCCILINNGFSNSVDIESCVLAFDNIVVVNNGKNLGIAKALNQIVEMAKGMNAKWVLTLDQDSVCSDNLIHEYESICNVKNAAILTCIIEDRNFEFETSKFTESYRLCERCISSGSYINVSIWEEIGGFDEKFFIDNVDTDYCYRIGIYGYKIYQIGYHGLLHEIGSNAFEKKIFRKHFVVFNHSPFRCYYIIRNQIYFARKHMLSLGRKTTNRYKRTAWTRIFVYLFFEERKLAKLFAWYKGLRDGYRM